MISVSKTALLGLTKCLAAETANDNIRVNCVAPGLVKTKFASALTDNESIADRGGLDNFQHILEVFHAAFS